MLEQYLYSALLAIGFDVEEIIFQRGNIAMHTTKIFENGLGGNHFVF